MSSTRISGHALVSEGAPHDASGRRNGYMGVGGEGRALCSCGALSPILTSGGQRQQWHREHKAGISLGTSSAIDEQQIRRVLAFTYYPGGVDAWMQARRTGRWRGRNAIEMLQDGEGEIVLARAQAVEGAA